MIAPNGVVVGMQRAAVTVANLEEMLRRREAGWHEAEPARRVRGCRGRCSASRSSSCSPSSRSRSRPSQSPAARANRLAHELRCPTCQSESVADSQSAAAIAMRADIKRRIAAGESDAEIRAAVVASYDEFVLLAPEAHGIGLIVWGAPIAALILGAGGLAFTLRRWSRQPRLAATAADEELVARGPRNELSIDEPRSTAGLLAAVARRPRSGARRRQHRRRDVRTAPRRLHRPGRERAARPRRRDRRPRAGAAAGERGAPDDGRRRPDRVRSRRGGDARDHHRTSIAGPDRHRWCAAGTGRERGARGRGARSPQRLRARASSTRATCSAPTASRRSSSTAAAARLRPKEPEPPTYIGWILGLASGQVTDASDALRAAHEIARRVRARPPPRPEVRRLLRVRRPRPRPVRERPCGRGPVVAAVPRARARRRPGRPRAHRAEGGAARGPALRRLRPRNQAANLRRRPPVSRRQPWRSNPSSRSTSRSSTGHDHDRPRCDGAPSSIRSSRRRR